jgi:hypothetical protein
MSSSISTIPYDLLHCHFNDIFQIENVHWNNQLNSCKVQKLSVRQIQVPTHVCNPLQCVVRMRCVFHLPK